MRQATTTLKLVPILHGGGIEARNTLVIQHAYVSVGAGLTRAARRAGSMTPNEATAGVTPWSVVGR